MIKKRFLCLLMLSACMAPENIDYEDRDAQLNRADYREALAPRPPAAEPVAPLPDFAPAAEVPPVDPLV